VLHEGRLGEQILRDVPVTPLLYHSAMLIGNIVHYKAPTIVPTAEPQFARTSRWSKWVQVDPDTAANSVEDSEMDAAF
jgi:hypothetical protein